MKYSLGWLSELVDLKNLKTEQIAEALNSRSFEVESIVSGVFAGQKDTVLEIDFGKTNRVDILGHLGLAMELGAVLGRKMKFAPKEKLPAIKQSAIPLTVDSRVCAKYIAVRIDGVNVTKSPQWLSSRLEASGIKSVNNIVDVTNYVMLLVGQPLHAFDAEQIEGGIVVRRAKQGEKYKSLDGKDYVLGKDDVVIADKKCVLALAGVMGGDLSKVTENSRSIILEAAKFDPIFVRRTSWGHNLRTESARRFEKNLPPEFVDAGVSSALELLTNVASAHATGLSVKNYARPTKSEILFDPKFVGDLLGYKEDHSAQVKKVIQTRLKFQLVKAGQKLKIKIPFNRPDLKLPADLVEEIGKLIGYGEIPEAAPNIRILPITNETVRTKEQIRDLLVSSGLDESYNYSFYSGDLAARFNLPERQHLKLANPLSGDQELLRISLLPNLHQAVEENLRNLDEAGLFELGNVYLKEKTDYFHDSPKVSLAYASKKHPVKESFLHVKGIIETLLKRLEIRPEFSPFSTQINLEFSLKIGQKSGIMIGEMGVANIGDFPIVSAELSLDEILRLKKDRQKNFKPFSRFPSKSVDVAVVVKEKVLWQEIEKYLNSQNLVEARLFDVYRGERIPQGTKSVAFTLKFQSSDRTLTDADVKGEMQEIIKSLERHLQARVR